MQRLERIGLSARGVLGSTGLKEHRERLETGRIDAERLDGYADSLETVASGAGRGGSVLPIDFWDVQSEAMRKTGIDEYAQAQRLSQAEFAPYLELLGRAFHRLATFKRGEGETAVATALDILVDCAEYVRAGYTAATTATWPRLHPKQRAIFLWQQIVAGSNRTLFRREVYTHGLWGRFNVGEIWSFQTSAPVDLSRLWGLSGFHDTFIRDPHNINQIEHMTITALAQSALHVPLVLLDLLEEIEWRTGRGSRLEGEGDKALNHAVSRFLLPTFSLEQPRRACDQLRNFLEKGH